MELEDVVSQTKYPLLGLEFLLDEMSETLAHCGKLYRDNNKEEEFNRLESLIALGIALKDYFQNFMQEIRQEVNDR